MSGRKIWFRNTYRWAPWSVHPVHWKGWVLMIAGPIILAGGANMLMFAVKAPLVVTSALIFGAGIAFMVAVYAHTSWD